MVINMILWIVILGFLIYGVVLLILKPFEKREDSTMEILKERLARGEIDYQEFEEKKKVLKSNN